MNKTIVASTVSAAPLVGYDKVMTVEAFNNYVIAGGTVGFWLAVCGAASLMLILVLNSVKLYKELTKKK